MIFAEVVMDEKKRFIEYEDFEKVMWTTNIDQHCVIYLYQCNLNKSRKFNFESPYNKFLQKFHRNS